VTVSWWWCLPLVLAGVTAALAAIVTRSISAEAAAVDAVRASLAIGTRAARATCRGTAVPAPIDQDNR
jgi:hypothetical protein